MDENRASNLGSTAKALVDKLAAQARQLWQRLNRRQLALRKPSGETVFRLPLGWSLALLVLLFAIPFAPLLVALGFLALLALKYQFVIIRDAPDA